MMLISEMEFYIPDFDVKSTFKISQLVCFCPSKISRVVRPLCTCGFHTVWSRERFSMCNNRSFWDSYCQAIAKVREEMFSYSHRDACKSSKGFLWHVVSEASMAANFHFSLSYSVL